MSSKVHINVSLPLAVFEHLRDHVAGSAINRSEVVSEAIASLLGVPDEVDKWSLDVEVRVPRMTGPITTARIVDTCAGIGRGEQAPAHLARMSSVLRGLGYRQIRRRQPDGTRPRVWVKEPA